MVGENGKGLVGVKGVGWGEWLCFTQWDFGSWLIVCDMSNLMINNVLGFKILAHLIMMNIKRIKTNIGSVCGREEEGLG